MDQASLVEPVNRTNPESHPTANTLAASGEPERAPAARIGVFDSGVGGLTVLRALRSQLPGAQLHYVADSANAPYGPRSSEFIVACSLRVADYLQRRGASMIVVACNTATAHAVAALRERWPNLPVVGIEPGVKPAVALSHNGRIGVMATSATLASERYQRLVEAHGGNTQVISQPCPGLVDLIETGELGSDAIKARVADCCAPLREAGVDTVLLGCTHYPLVEDLIQAELGTSVRLLRIEDAVARQAARLFSAAAGSAQEGRMELESTGDPAPLQRLAALALGWREQARHIEI